MGNPSFMCLVADIERQFEFVMQTWIDNPTFGDLNGEVDPLIGNRAGRGNGIFTIPCAPYRARLHEVPSFVTTRGGAYAFLPSLTALAYLAKHAP